MRCVHPGCLTCSIDYCVVPGRLLNGFFLAVFSRGNSPPEPAARILFFFVTRAAICVSGEAAPPERALIGAVLSKTDGAAAAGSASATVASPASRAVRIVVDIKSTFLFEPETARVPIQKQNGRAANEVPPLFLNGMTGGSARRKQRRLSPKHHAGLIAGFS